MAQVRIKTEYPPVVLQLQPALEMNEEQFFAFCQQNRDWRIERTAEGELEVMPPTGGETGNRNAILTAQLTTWALQDGTGVAFDSSTGFNLPNGATRSPDASWVRRERLAELTDHQKSRFLPLCPDFVVELRSPSDPLAMVEAKMREYVENGARLGWLIAPEEQKVHRYRPEAPVEVLDDPRELSGEQILPGFVLDLRRIREPGL